ncbi:MULTISPECIES: riboflavin synthase [Paenibacillus]|jgi:riboflavin synthase|uniref:riboflavin synthase n=1 Tax=Paenibacillus TaxID=44249 RepID=UPI0002EC4A30|nr:MULTISPECIES: riboflavin synthase [Paenibacillus]KAE8558467.1 riboflavin synthase subunit alpha [Paenibacillus polymyxa]KAF6584265.1 riboflavin synthase [Paenibacillus sp. EKM211P]KAF6620235.1 riboflavin synthase [Paenibacillus sp. EKM101P]KAF6623227.1 riboflavin synthase [Paenibacillus sp. EKM102P]KAF6634213.1 riboflavin synthase [Paenibacillus sp. EKM10P]
MFTGLVEEVGRIQSISKSGEAMVLGISGSVVLDDLKIGDSVSVNGVCLTAIQIGTKDFKVDVMPETFRSSNLRELRSGSRVNLERAMAASGRFGGHIVQGHVDGTGTIRGVTSEQNAVVFEVEPSDQALFKYVLLKGSITIDGISLTVAQRTRNSFAVSIIPHTLAETALQAKREGDTVNIECDILGKYVEQLLHYRGSASMERADQAPLSLDYLAKHGFA